MGHKRTMSHRKSARVQSAAGLGPIKKSGRIQAMQRKQIDSLQQRAHPGQLSERLDVNENQLSGKLLTERTNRQKWNNVESATKLRGLY